MTAPPSTTPGIADLLGKPFGDGGRGPDAWDCWGLAREVFRRYGIALPDYRIGCLAAAEIDRKVAEQKPFWSRVAGEPPVPALVLMHTARPGLLNHVGVYLGRGEFIHAMSKTGVCKARTDSPLWRHRIEGYYIPRR